MFIGHWAPALAAAAASKRAPKIGTLFVAAQLVDWAFFGLLLLGVEHMRFSPGISVMNPMDLYDMPLTHSLLGAAGFAAAFAALVWLASKDSLAALIAAAVVLSHWLLDLLVHVPDDTSDPETFLVPIDACYEFVGGLRMRWRGFDGGSSARDFIDDFFAQVAARSRPVPP